MEILLTNDDSHDSPLFLFALEILSTLGSITVVAPKHEQSWMGKSITRFRPLRLEQIEIHGIPAMCLDGTPADCANFGIHHLFDKKPDLVVSGINMGRNTGLGFAFSSGTIGACLEGNIAGIPGIALSQPLSPETFQQWTEKRQLPNEVLTRLRAQTQILLDRVFEMLLSREDFGEPITWNVNLPFEAAEHWQIIPTYIGHTFYGSCFKKEGDLYHHRLGPTVPDRRENSDYAVVEAGHVSLSRLDIRTFGQLNT